MTLDWNAFTPWSALAGGVLIGLAAAMFLLLNDAVEALQQATEAVESTSAGTHIVSTIRSPR